MTSHISSRVNGRNFTPSYAISNNNFQINPEQTLIKRSAGRPRKEPSEKKQIEKIQNPINNDKSHQVNSFGEIIVFQSISLDNKNKSDEKKSLNMSRSTEKKENVNPYIEVIEDEPIIINKINNSKTSKQRPSNNNSSTGKKSSNLIIVNSNDRSNSSSPKTTDISDILTPSQQRVFAYFATLNPQSLIKDDKFLAMKSIISNKYTDDRVNNFLCMYLLYSEKELKNSSGSKDFDPIPTNNNFNNISFNSIKICNNQISENFSNLKGKKFEEKNLSVIPKVNDFNILTKEDSKKCFSAVIESKSISRLTPDDKKPNESENISKERAESTLPSNIFNNFSQIGGMKEIQNPYQYSPYNFPLPNMPFNPSQSPFFYNPWNYCMPPVIPPQQMLNYTNTQYQAQFANGIYTKPAEKEKENTQSKSSSEEKKENSNLPQEKPENKSLLRKKRQRNLKNKTASDTSKSHESSVNMSEEEINKTLNDLVIQIEPNTDSFIPTQVKYISPTATDIFDKVSKEMEIIEKTPSFRANEEPNYFNDNSFSRDNFSDFNNEFLYSPKTRDNLDLASLTDNNFETGVLSFNNDVDKGFHEKFPSKMNLSVYSVVQGEDQFLERKSKETQNKLTKSAVSVDKSNPTANLLSLKNNLANRSQRAVQSTSNINDMSKSLLPSLLESKLKKDEADSHSADIIEKKNKIIKLLEDISNRSTFDKLRNLIPEKSFLILEDCFYLQSNEIMNKTEVTVCLVANFFLKFIPITNGFTVFRSGPKK